MTSIALVLSGTFVYRSGADATLLSRGAMLLGNAGRSYECSHEHGEGDRCLTFQFEPELFERLAHDAGAARAEFGRDSLPPLRPIAPLFSRAVMAMVRKASFEEIALEIGAAVLQLTGEMRRGSLTVQPRDRVRTVRVLRHLEANVSGSHTLADLARIAGLSRYHFLRTFKNVVGITPHQWILRIRLRHAARQLLATGTPVTEIALSAGFDDLSNFIRSFRAEFGVSPRRYRAGVF